MARADYVARVKDILYGTELGEAPPLRVGAADAGEALTAPLVTFSVLAGEGAKIKAGDTLAKVNNADPTGCQVVRVTAVSTDSVTAVDLANQLGTPAVAAGSLDSALLEQNPLVNTFKIHKAIDTIFALALWPKVFVFANHEITPNFTTGQVNLPATVMGIENAYQNSSVGIIPIPFGRDRNIDTDLVATGVLGYFDFVNGNTVYITAVEKAAIGDEDEDVNGLVELVATGAAALCLGATVSETAQARSARDSRERGQKDVASMLWRDFLTLRNGYMETFGSERGTRLVIDRG